MEPGNEPAVTMVSPLVPDVKPWTGVPECDQLFDRAVACYDKMGESGAQAKEAFREGAKYWQNLAKDPRTKKQATAACREAIEASTAAWEGAGC
jgi:hypothetical protein